MKVNKNPCLVWDQCDIVENEVKFRLENLTEDDKAEIAEALDLEDDTPDYLREEKTEEYVRNQVYQDSDLFQSEWEWLGDCLTEIMQKVNPNGYWKVTVNNFGWQHLDGYKFFEASKGKDLLREVLPDTDCTFSIYKADHGRLVFNNAHHDAPCGGEMYYISPVSKFHRESWY